MVYYITLNHIIYIYIYYMVVSFELTCDLTLAYGYLLLGPVLLWPLRLRPPTPTISSHNINSQNKTYRGSQIPEPLPMFISTRPYETSNIPGAGPMFPLLHVLCWGAPALSATPEACPEAAAFLLGLARRGGVDGSVGKCCRKVFSCLSLGKGQSRTTL